MAFSRILIAVDGSDESLAAAKEAVEIASRNEGAEVIALHILEIPSFAYYHSVETTNQLIEKCKLEAEACFKQIEKSTEESNVKLRTETVVSFLPVYSEIVNYAEQKVADLIIVGTQEGQV